MNTVKGSGIVNKAEVDVFLELSCFFDDPTDAGNLICFYSAWTIKNYSAKELMLSNCGVGEDSSESLGLQGDPTSPS